MPPKRTKSADGTASAVKRAKALLHGESDTALKSSTMKKTATPKMLSDPEDTDDEEKMPIRQHKAKQQQPKPKKKGSTTSSSAVQEPKYTKPQQSSTPTPPTLSNQSYILKAKKGAKENQENHFPPSGNSSNSGNRSKDDGKEYKVSSRLALGMSAERLEAAYEELNTKYKRLKQLKETDAEKNLKDCRAKLEESTRSAENYRAQIEPQLESALRNQEKLRDNNEILNAKVRTLQRQVREYEEKSRQRDMEDKVKAKTASMESILASPDITPSSAANASTIKLYENLSGFKVMPRDIYPRTSKDKLPTVWDCEHNGPRGTLRFTLTYNYTSGEVTYEPHLDAEKDKELIRILPDYLRDAIEFEQQFESKFFWRILNFNHEEL
ncbi:hypothetical protein EDD11_002210 [Mortierella claussenii]|nr:hypothetical protein EDD11_002210 [Mortierella claussenii]